VRGRRCGGEDVGEKREMRDGFGLLVLGLGGERKKRYSTGKARPLAPRFLCARDVFVGSRLFSSEPHVLHKCRK
jgi:hypothetical protein